MKKYCIAACVCLVSAAGFSQSQQTAIREKAKDPSTIQMAAIADTTLVDKKAIVEEKKKRPKRESNHKECSRMKS